MLYQGMNTTDMYTTMQSIADSSHDMIAHSSKLSVYSDGAKRRIHTEPIRMGENNWEAVNNSLIDSHADSQLAKKLDIPKAYYDRMAGESPRLWEISCNDWLDKLNKTLMLRTWTNRNRLPSLRAIVSNSYLRIDNLDIFKTILPILNEQPDMKIVSGHVDEHRFNLKAIFPRIQGEVAVNDVVQAGVHIQNTETGNGAFKIEPFQHRLVCLNGMIIPEAGIRKAHLGSRIGEGTDINFRNETLEADNKAFMMKVEDATRQATDETRFTYIVNQLKESTERTIDVSPVEQVKILTKKQNLTEEENNTILMFLHKSDGNTHWDVANAVTSAAGVANNYQSATALETLGGQIATTPQLLAA